MELLVNETWRDIPGYEGRYRVSSIGNIMSVGHITIDKRGVPRRLPDKILSIAYGKNDRYGYGHVSLCNTRFWVHRAVALAFLPNPDNLPQVNHKDGNKKNNRIENLEWCSARDNLLHAFKTGLHPNEAFEKDAGKRAVIVTSPNGETMRFSTVNEASVFLGYKWPSNLSTDMHKNNGKCRGGFFVRREDNFVSKHRKNDT